MKKSLILIFSILLWQSCGTGIQSTFPDEKITLKKAGQYAPRKVKEGVEFTYVTKGKKKSVYIAGTFNNWDKGTSAMKEIEPGIWKTVLPLKTGRYEYKFYINQEMWVGDRQNPAMTDDGWGNAIIAVDEKQVHFPQGGISAADPGYLYANTRAYDSPQWVRDTVIYELFPRAYTKKGYKGLIKKLDYLTNLGIDTIWVMPTFPIGKVKRKGTLGSPYSVKDYYKINPEFGTEQDFREFVEQSHARGLKVILDWVPNHSSWDNELLKTHPEYYMKDEKGKIIMPPETDWSDVAQFDYKNQGMQDYMIGALKYWVEEYGIDGYRMDVAGRVPHAFWNRLRTELNKIRPDILLLAESEDAEHHINGFDLTYAGHVRVLTQHIGGGKDTQYDFHKTIEKKKYSYPQGSLRMHWMENHDGEHALKFMGDKLVYPAAVVHLTMDGVPMLHQGQEFGDTQWQDWRSLFDPVQLDWDKFDQTLFEHYQALIALRRSSPALSRGELILVENDRKKVVSYARVLGQEKYLIVANLSGKKQMIQFNKKDLKKAGLKLGSIEQALVLAKGLHKEAGNVSLPLELEAWSSIIIKVK